MRPRPRAAAPSPATRQVIQPLVPAGGIQLPVDDLEQGFRVDPQRLLESNSDERIGADWTRLRTLGDHIRELHYYRSGRHRGTPPWNLRIALGRGSADSTRIDSPLHLVFSPRELVLRLGDGRRVARANGDAPTSALRISPFRNFPWIRRILPFLMDDEPAEM